MNIIKSLKHIAAGTLVYCLGAALFATTSYASHNSGSSGGSTSASLSDDTLNLSINDTGSWTISGNDGGSYRQFRWSLPSG